MLLNHIDIQVADFDASARFYDAVFAAIGAHRQLDFSPKALSWGRPDGGPDFWISALVNGDGFRESHIAFTASTREAVDAFEAAAREQGAEVLHAAREWPEYQGGPLVCYYAAFVRDPDGNNIEAAFMDFDFAAEAA